MKFNNKKRGFVMLKKSLVAALLYMVLLFTNSALAIEYVDLATEEGPHAMIQKEGSLALWDELNSRKRLNNFFTNEQAQSYGVQVNYVNVGTGNLTFIRRDLVRADRIPIVFGRVYDSRIRENADFGPGWKITVQESLERTRNGYLYTDASNTAHRLVDVKGVLRPVTLGDEAIQGVIKSKHIELRVSGFKKVFEKKGKLYLLKSIGDQFKNGIKFKYKHGRLVRIASTHGRFIELKRDSSGRVIAASDDIGRTVSYSYDHTGRLSLVSSVGQWQIAYDDQHYLLQITDPRDEVVLRATFDLVGKAISVQVLHENTDFHFSPGRTTITDGLSRSATFWQNDAGLTQTIQDLTGSLTHIEFNADNRPVSLLRDGEKQLVIEYGSRRRRGGEPSKISRWDESNWIHRSLRYDRHGQLRSIREGKTIVAEYAYSKHGLLTRAEDSLGGRSYRYGPDGLLRGIAYADQDLDLKINRLGELERLRNDSGDTLDLRYDGADRVAALELRRSDLHYAAVYTYDQNGLRTSANYTLDDSKHSEFLFGYDQVGNLTKLSHPSGENERLEFNYVVGPANEVQRIDTSAHINYTMHYDNIGRLTQVAAGTRDAEYEYDDDGQVNAVRVDDRHVSWENKSDRDFSSLFLSPKRRVSGVFGSIDEIIYTRFRGTPLGPIIFDRNRLAFVASGFDAMPSDTNIITSLGNRYLLNEQGMINPIPLEFDKPSNMLFIPPEYASVNCSFCIVYVASATFTVNGRSSAVVATNQAVKFRLSAPIGACILYSFSIWGGGSSYVSKPWLHSMTYGDGEGVNAWGSFNKTFSHLYNSNGTYVGRDTVKCGCSSVFSFLSAAATVRACVAQPIIDEYLNKNRTPTPTCSQFTSTAQSTHFLVADLKAPSYASYIVGSMTNMAESVRAEYNNLVDSNSSTDYGLDMGTGYRNPVYNDSLSGSEPLSKHQWGKAIDLDPGRLPPGYSIAQAMNLIKTAADNVFGSSYTVLHEGNHIHSQYNR